MNHERADSAAPIPVLRKHRTAQFTSLCDYCESVITVGDIVGRVDEGRYICLACTRTARRHGSSPHDVR